MSSPCPPRRASRLRSFLSHHALLAFFVLAFGLSWLAWTPFVLGGNGLGVLPLTVPGDPAISQLYGVLPGAYLGPITAALVVTALTEGRSGLHAWRGRLLRLRVGWRWPLAITVGVPAVILASTFVLPSAWSAARPFPPILLLLYLPMLAIQILTTSLAEEPGWRDFALPRLQRRWGPLAGTVILGLLWGAWHLPLFLTTWAGPHPTWWGPVVFVASSVPLSLVMTWVFNRTGQSVPMVMLLHAGVNSTFSLLWPAMFPAMDLETTSITVQLIASSLAALVLIVVTRGRLGLEARPSVSVSAPTPHADPRPS